MGKPKAPLQCTRNPLSSALLRLIHQEGIEPELDAWRSRTSLPGKRTCVQDGDIWTTLPGHDKTPFLDHIVDRSDPDELRIAVTLEFYG